MLAAPRVMVTPPPARNATVPPATPGPVPSLSARSTTSPSVVVMTALTFTLRPAFATKLPRVAVIAEFTFTSRTAFNVRVVGAVGTVTDQVITASTLISPNPVPLVPLFAVVIVTSVPRFKAVVMVVRFTLAVLALELGVKTSGLPPLNVPPLFTAPVIVTSAGSSSHVPLLPFGALALMLMPNTSSQWPEVSIKPPSPPCAPPRAVMLP